MCDCDSRWVSCPDTGTMPLDFGLQKEKEEGEFGGQWSSRLLTDRNSGCAESLQWVTLANKTTALLQLGSNIIWSLQYKSNEFTLAFEPLNHACISFPLWASAWVRLQRWRVMETQQRSKECLFVCFSLCWKNDVVLRLERKLWKCLEK